MPEIGGKSKAHPSHPPEVRGHRSQCVPLKELTPHQTEDSPRWVCPVPTGEQLPVVPARVPASHFVTMLFARLGHREMLSRPSTPTALAAFVAFVALVAFIALVARAAFPDRNVPGTSRSSPVIVRLFRVQLVDRRLGDSRDPSRRNVQNHARGQREHSRSGNNSSDRLNQTDVVVPLLERIPGHRVRLVQPGDDSRRFKRHVNTPCSFHVRYSSSVIATCCL